MEVFFSFYLFLTLVALAQSKTTFSAHDQENTEMLSCTVKSEDTKSRHLRSGTFANGGSVLEVKKKSKASVRQLPDAEQIANAVHDVKEEFTDMTKVSTDSYGPFLIIGTDQQRKITKDALGKIKFPLDKLKLPNPKIEWLSAFNGGGYSTGDGHVRIEQSLVNNPSLATEIIISEVAHCVSYGLPITVAQQNKIIALVCPGGGCSWWPTEKNNDLYSLMHENFMQHFTLAYTDVPFTDEKFRYRIKPSQAPLIRKILGIERTDNKK